MYYDDREADAKLGKVKDPIVRAIKWMKSRSQKEKGIMGAIGAFAVSALAAPAVKLGGAWGGFIVCAFSAEAHSLTSNDCSVTAMLLRQCCTICWGRLTRNMHLAPCSKVGCQSLQIMRLPVGVD